MMDGQIRPTPLSSLRLGSLVIYLRNCRHGMCKACYEQWKPYSHRTSEGHHQLGLLKSASRKKNVEVASEDGSNDAVGLVASVRQSPTKRSSSARPFDAKKNTSNHVSTMITALMLHFTEKGQLGHSQALWAELINSSIVLHADIVSPLMTGYARMGYFDEILKMAGEMALRNPDSGYKGYNLAVSCFGKYGKLDMMEVAVREMVLKGYRVDSILGNSFVRYYSMFGSISQMDAAYQRLKKSRILIEKETFHAMALKYIKENKYYKLGEFLKDVGLARRDLGNLVWNFLLLSYAARFKMKTLQREFLNMLEAGFSPDLTTFNIRALAFSRMCMFWDLHLSLDHMKRDRITPDLVTYGCFVDAYVERRLASSLSFALDKMDGCSAPTTSTNPLVFEAFGKGDFHASSEVLMHSRRKQKWTYQTLVNVYLKKVHRSNQVFWNY